MASSLPSPFGRLHPVLFELWLPNGPNIAWQVARVHGEEGISTAYEFVLDLATDDPLAAYEEMLGADCELLLDRNGVIRTVYGIIDEVQAVMSAESRVSSAGLVVRARVVPAFKLLDQQIDTRFFAGQNVVDLLRDLLTPALQVYERTIDVTSFIKLGYEKRDYCVQFRESTFAFCNRIMEEEGIAYVFVNDDEEHKEKLVLIDSNADYREADLLVPEAIPIVLSRPDELDRESIQAFDWRDSRTPNKILTRGYNFKVPSPPDEGTAERTDPHNPKTREHFLDDDRRQIVDDPIDDPEAQSFTGASLAQRAPQAQRLLQRHTLESATGHGRANAIGLMAGRTFTLGEHPQASLDHHQFLLTRVIHEGAMGGGGSGGPERSYGNRFECIPVTHEFRPALRTPKPRVHGIQTGVVVGRAQDEIYTDQFGRIRVKFHRDRHSGNDEQASCWIRVAQIWAGPGYGSVVIPRVGMEVVVAFVDGNPDCPIVTGCVYDGQNMPPYPLPAEVTKTTFKTSSSPGGDGFNELRFEDAHGSEQVFIHAQRRMDMRIRGSLYETCGGNREEKIGWERGEEQGGDHNTLVHKDVNHHVKEIRYTKIDKEQYETVTLDLIEDFQTKHTVLVGEVSQLSAPKVVVEASDLISHKAGSIKLTGSSTIDLKAGGKLALESNNAIEIKVGASFISITPGEIAIQAVSVRINSGGGVGPAGEAEAAVPVEMLDPLDALGADDGQLHTGGGGGGGGRARTGRTLDPHHAPPMQPPPPPPPGNPSVLPDGTLRQFLTIEWVQVETWCSDPATLRGTTQGYTDGDTESANVRNAVDGAVQRAVTLTITSNAYSFPFDVINLLPRRVGANFETERTLDAIAVGQTTPTAIRLRFIPTLTLTRCTIGRAHFDLSVTNYEALMGGTINYVPGWIQYIIQLGATVPAGTGGDVGVNWAANPGSFGGGGWRYAKRNATGALVYWDGTAPWKPVPATWADPANILLYPIAIWVEGTTSNTQFGTTPWPEAIPAWSAAETTLATTTLATWTTNINAMWTGKFDLKRIECRSTDAQCCRYKTRCSVTFVQVATKGSGIVLAANNGRSNAGVWSLGDNRPGMPPHEFGHHLGNPDEYAGGVGVDGTVNTDGATAGIDANSIMGSGMVTVKRRHYNTVVQHLAAMVSTQFSRTYTYNAVPVV
jgi:type VI secretion system VgrG family protein